MCTNISWCSKEDGGKLFSVLLGSAREAVLFKQKKNLFHLKPG